MSKIFYIYYKIIWAEYLLRLFENLNEPTETALRHRDLGQEKSGFRTALLSEIFAYNIHINSVITQIFF